MRHTRLALLALLIVPLAAPAADPPAPGWTDDLSKMKAPDKPASGKLLGGDFKVENAQLGGGRVLTLRQGKEFLPDAAVIIFLGLNPGDTLEGKKFEVAVTDEVGKPPHIHVRRMPPGEKQPQASAFVSGYAMKLEFGKAQGGKIPGKIYLCMPDDQKSYVAGTFTVEAK
jgi:hypothetical protein